MDECATSFLYLKNSMAAMVAPIINSLAPALDFVIDKVVDLLNLVNKFFALLSGASTYTVAKKVATSYAESAEDAASATKRAAKEIKDATSGLDELNIISQKDDSGNGDKETDYSSMFEELPLDTELAKIGDFLADLFTPLKEAWELHGEDVVQSFWDALSAVKDLLKDIARTWMDVWLNGSGAELCSNILLLLKSMLNWIADIARAWDAAWQVKGHAYVQSVFDALNEVLLLIYTISESFRKAFNSGSGQEMAEHLLQIWTDINNTIANLARRFREAWTEAGTGDAIALSIFDIFNTVLGTIEKITTATSKWSAQLNFSPLLKSVKNLLEQLHPVIQKIGDALAWVWENVILPLASWATLVT